MKHIWIRNVSVYSKTIINLIQIDSIWFYSIQIDSILWFYLNKIDNGFRINRNVSNSNMFHIFLALIFLIKLSAKPIFSAPKS